MEIFVTLTEETILALALDPCGLAPLGDYLQELEEAGRGWYNPDVIDLIYPEREKQGLPEIPGKIHWLQDGRKDWFAANAAQPTPTFAKAIAAVLMGGVFLPPALPSDGVVLRCEIKEPWPYDSALLDRISASVNLIRMEGESDEALRDRYEAYVGQFVSNTYERHPGLYLNVLHPDA